MKYKILLLLVLSSIAIYRTDGFIIDKIYSSLVYKDRWEVELPSNFEKITSILDQKFHYLDSGRQCFVFESADKRYVIKFLNHARFSMPSILRALPLPEPFEKIRKERVARRVKRKTDFLESFYLGYCYLKRETEILFMQLKPKGIFTKNLTLQDPTGHEHTVDLNKTNFILQKRVDTMLYPYIEGLDDKKCERLIDDLINLMMTRIDQKIMDDDLNLEVNIGILEGKPVLIDIGRLFYTEELKPKKELVKSLKFLHRYFKDKRPHMAEYLDEQIQRRSYENPTTNHSAYLWKSRGSTLSLKPEYS